MINNTTNITSAKPTHTTQDLKQLTTTINQIQSMPNFQSSIESSPLIKNLMQLIQNILAQLNQGNHQSQNTNGTRGNDNLEGSTGNDKIKARQGNDFVDGKAGNDKLYGGQGDDTLSGGTGDDYLSGGRGNNRLFGGDGNDILSTRLGSDFIDGGRGTDTTRVRGNIDDYDISVSTVFPQGIKPEDTGALFAVPDNAVVLTHKETGQTITSINVEQFRFNDARLSFDEMKARVTVAPKPLDISSIPNQKLLAIFNRVEGLETGKVTILDNNGDGKLSAGDTAQLKSTDGSIIEEKTLTANDVATLNGPDQTQAQAALDANVQKWNEGGMTDYRYQFQRSCFCTPDHTRAVETTVKDGEISASNYVDGAQEPSIDANQKSITDLFAQIQTAIDQGRQVEVEYDETTGMPTKITIDRDMMAFDGGETITISNFQTLDDIANELPLTEQQSKNLSDYFNKGTTTFTGTVLDSDGSGDLSVGDIVKLTIGGVAGNINSEQALTTADLAAINNTTNPLLTLTGSLSDDQKQRLNTAILDQTLAYAGGGPSANSVFDKDGNQQLSVGDTVIFNRFNETSGNIDQTQVVLTQAQLDRYLANEAYIPQRTQ